MTTFALVHEIIVLDLFTYLAWKLASTGSRDAFAARAWPPNPASLAMGHNPLGRGIGPCLCGLLAGSPRWSGSLAVGCGPAAAKVTKRWFVSSSSAAEFAPNGRGWILPKEPERLLPQRSRAQQQI